LLYPVAIRYRNVIGNVCQEAAYLESSLFFSLQKILSQVKINAELTFAEPIPCGMKNRRELARLAERAIADRLSVPIVHKKVEKLFDPLAG
jgi:1-acyl-sn-glycerol-3-phosphate acyltransferase